MLNARWWVFPDGTVLPVIAGSGPASSEQANFRARNDDGNETGASWIEAADTDWSQETGQNFRIRFRLVQSGMDNAYAHRLQYNLNDTGWNDVSDLSSVVRATASTHYTSGSNTTQQVGSGTFQAGRIVHSTGDTASFSHVAGQNTEVEYCVEIRNADVSGGTIQLRDTQAGTAHDTYTNMPTITVVVSLIEGSVAQTLPALGQSASGELSIDGDLSQEFSALSQAASGEITVPVGDDPVFSNEVFGLFQFGGDPGEDEATPVEAAIANTLSVLATAATVELTVEAEVSDTLPALQTEASTELAVEVAVANALSVLESDAAGELAVAGEVAQDLPALTQAATGEIPDDVTAEITQALPGFQQDATGSLAVTTETANTLPAFSQQVELAATVDTDIAHTLSVLAAEANSAVTVAGETAHLLPVLNQDAAATLSIAGEASHMLSALQQSVEGIAGQALDGAIAQTLPVLTHSAAGEVGVDADIAGTLSALTQQATTLSGDPVTAQIDATLPGLGQEFAALLFVVSDAANALPGLTSNGEGQVSVMGIAELALPVLETAVVAELPIQRTEGPTIAFVDGRVIVRTAGRQYIKV